MNTIRRVYKGWSVHGGHDACRKLERKFATSHFGKESTVRKRHSQDLPHPLTNPRSACLMRLDKKGKEVVLKNTGVGRTVDLRAQVNDLHIPTEASEPWGESKVSYSKVRKLAAKWHG